MSDDEDALSANYRQIYKLIGFELFHDTDYQNTRILVARGHDKCDWSQFVVLPIFKIK